MRLAHLGLTVTDQERSRRFYETHFGFGARPATRYEDGTLIIRDADGFDLALHPGAREHTEDEFLHFGFGCADAEEVRALRAHLLAAGVRLVEEEDTDGYVAFKALDPDGYRVEVYWEP
jgi:catechol 2,3-dioxygenase-like lactoylglutathione lyase family enzyme